MVAMPAKETQRDFGRGSEGREREMSIKFLDIDVFVSKSVRCVYFS